MKKFAKSVLGVTLLEIMLVLAIAAMIIVMSVRYYQSATTNQQVNAALQMVQGIAASADNLAQATGSYAAATQADIFKLLGSSAGTMNTPWGTAVSIAPGASGSEYTVTFPNTPGPVCLLLKARLMAGRKFSTTASCTGTAPFVYTYDATK